MSIPLKLTATQNWEPPTLDGGTSFICLPAMLQKLNFYRSEEPQAPRAIYFNKSITNTQQLNKLKEENNHKPESHHIMKQRLDNNISMITRLQERLLVLTVEDY
jgi:hypothetical protein